MLNMQGRLAVVVGGGGVGLRKVHSLLETGADVKLVTDELPDDAPGLKQRGVIVIHKPYCAEFLEGALLVFACTDDRALNAQIAQDAQWVGAIANVADQPEDCDFYLPAVHGDGEVVLAVGTGGAAPALAGQLRDRLAAALPDRIGEFAAALGELRTVLKQRCPQGKRRMEIMKQLSDPASYDAFLSGGEAALREKLAALIGA